MTDLSDVQVSVIRSMADNDMVVSFVADSLHYHRQNIKYHINQIRKKTGLDPKRFYDLVKLVEMVGGMDDDGKAV